MFRTCRSDQYPPLATCVPPGLFRARHRAIRHRHCRGHHSIFAGSHVAQNPGAPILVDNVKDQAVTVIVLARRAHPAHVGLCKFHGKVPAITRRIDPPELVSRCMLMQHPLTGYNRRKWPITALCCTIPRMLAGDSGGEGVRRTAVPPRSRTYRSCLKRPALH